MYIRDAHVDGWDVYSVSFDDIHHVIRRSVRLSNRDICVCYPVLTQDGPDLVVVDVGERHGICDGYTTFFLLPNGDRWRFLVKSDPETFEF